MLKKISNFMISFYFAIILFIVIAIYSVIGTLLPQGVGSQFYLENYSTFGSLMLTLQFNKVYSSLIFRTLLLLFIINLLGCTLKILPKQIKKTKKEYFPVAGDKSNNLFREGLDLIKFKKSLKDKKYSIEETENGFRASKHRFGILGPSLTHLGIIIIILGSFLGNLFAEEGFVNIMPGQTVSFEDYNFSLKLDDFYLTYRDDLTTEQYYSELKVLEDGQVAKEEKIWVNKPLAYKGLNFYQSSYGWTSKISIKDKDGNLLEEDNLKNGENIFYQPEHLTVLLYGFFPNFTLDKSGKPISITEELENPHYAVVLYEFNQYINSYIVEPGMPLVYNDLEIVFDNSSMYTGLIYRKDFGYYFVLLGCFFLFLGLLLSFYLYPKFIMVEENTIIPITRQNTWGFTFKLKKILGLNFYEGEEM